jgi:hypothetical protein
MGDRLLSLPCGNGGGEPPVFRAGYIIYAAAELVKVGKFEAVILVGSMQNLLRYIYPPKSKNRL